MGKKRRKKKRSRKNRWIKTTFISVCFLSLLLILAGVIFVGIQISNAPDISEIDARPEGYLTTVLDKDGEVMKNLFV